MTFDEYYVVLLRKGPTWTPGDSPELETLQAAHLAHISQMAAAGAVAAVGPLEDHAGLDLRGMTVFYARHFDSLERLKALVEQDPAIQVGRLRAEYLTWYNQAEIHLRQTPEG